MKKTVALLLTLLFSSCSLESEKQEGESAPIITKQLSCLITGSGGLGDRAFNDMLYNGMILSNRELKIPFRYETPQNFKIIEQSFEKMVKQGCNIIFAGSYKYKDIVDKFAAKNPNIKFILIDAIAKKYRKNVASLSFKQNEGSFLVGALAAMVSKTNKIAIVAGQDVKVINDFIIGYKAGAKYIKKDIKITTKFIEKVYKNKNPWASPREAKQISLKLLNKNIDIIYGVASASNIGIFQAAKLKGKFAIGVDSDQDYLQQGTVLTSMMKNLDIGILHITDNIIKNNFKNKSYRLGIKQKGVGISKMKYTKHFITNSYLKRIKKIKEDIVNGKIKVPSSY